MIFNFWLFKQPFLDKSQSYEVSIVQSPERTVKGAVEKGPQDRFQMFRSFSWPTERASHSYMCTKSMRVCFLSCPLMLSTGPEWAALQFELSYHNRHMRDSMNATAWKTISKTILFQLSLKTGVLVIMKTGLLKHLEIIYESFIITHIIVWGRTSLNESAQSKFTLSFGTSNSVACTATFRIDFW